MWKIPSPHLNPLFQMLDTKGRLGNGKTKLKFDIFAPRYLVFLYDILHESQYSNPVKWLIICLTICIMHLTSMYNYRPQRFNGGFGNCQAQAPAPMHSNGLSQTSFFWFCASVPYKSLDLTSTTNFFGPNYKAWEENNGQIYLVTFKLVMIASKGCCWNQSMIGIKKVLVGCHN